MSRAQLGERVELAGGARELVVERRQHLLLDLLDRHLDRSSSPRRASSNVSSPSSRRPSSRRAPARPPRRAGRRRARRRSRAAPRPAALTRSTTTVSPSCTGRPSTGASSATRAAERRRARRRRPPAAPSASGLPHLELRPVGELGLRLDVELGGEAPVPVVGRRQLVVVLGLRDGSDARRGRPRSRTSRRCGSRPPRVEPLLADALRASTGIGTLPWRKPGILTLAGEVGRRVLDRVLDVVRAGRRPSGGRGCRRAPRSRASALGRCTRPHPRAAAPEDAPFEGSPAACAAGRSRPRPDITCAPAAPRPLLRPPSRGVPAQPRNRDDRARAGRARRSARTSTAASSRSTSASGTSSTRSRRPGSRSDPKALRLRPRRQERSRG